MGPRCTKRTFLPLRHVIAPSLLLTPFLFLTVIAANEAPPQQPLLRHEENHKNDELRVAIIGAGIAGASAAHHLHSQVASGSFHGRPVTITIIESSHEVGGQVKTISPPGYERYRFKPLELGAAAFFEDDWCLMNAAQATQTALSQSRKNRYTNDGKWILNESHLIQDRLCEINDLWPRYWTWREVKSAVHRALDLLRLERTYQFLPWQIHLKLKDCLERFREFGRNGSFDNVIQELERCGIGQEVFSSTASGFLERMGMARDLQRVLLEPCIKEGYGLSSNEASGLHAVLSAGAIRSNQSVVATDSNQSLIDRMIVKSGAVLHLNSRVVKLEAGTQRRFSLTRTYKRDGEEAESSQYDVIIVTGNALQHLHSLDLKIPPRKQSTTFKTFFSTTDQLNATSIGVNASKVPRSVLFASRKDPSSLKSDETPFGLSSLTTWPEFYIDSTGCLDGDDCDQLVNTYITESTRPLSQDDLSRLVGGHEPISWSRSHSWPRNLPVLNSSDPFFGDVQVVDYLFDAGNRLVDSMEMSCRMGRNIALKISGLASGYDAELG